MTVVRPLPALALLLAVAGPAMAADEEFVYEPFNELRIGLQQTITPEIRESINSGSGFVRTWKGRRSYTNRFSAEWLSGTTTDGVGLLWGGELGFQFAKLQASDVASELSYRNVGVNFLIGPQYGINGYTGVRGHLELLGFAGVGHGRFNVENADTNVTGVAVGADNTGFLTYEAGIRAGAFVSERHVTAGFTLAWVAEGGASKDVENDRGNTTNIDVSANGARWGFLIGARF